MGFGLAIMVFASAALSGCSKEGGYTAPDTRVAAPAKENNCTAAANLTISSWGPQSTSVGVVFNAQPDGSAALWVKVNESLKGRDAVVTMDGEPLHSATSGKLITAAVPRTFYAKSGVHTLHVTTKVGTTLVESNDVSFVVH
ncbi:MAG: hypothetical protein ABI247_11295 [Rhodanobacter sp.]